MSCVCLLPENALKTTVFDHDKQDTTYNVMDIWQQILLHRFRLRQQISSQDTYSDRRHHYHRLFEVICYTQRWWSMKTSLRVVMLMPVQSSIQWCNPHPSKFLTICFTTDRTFSSTISRFAPSVPHRIRPDVANIATKHRGKRETESDQPCDMKWPHTRRFGGCVRTRSKPLFLAQKRRAAQLRAPKKKKELIQPHHVWATIS